LIRDIATARSTRASICQRKCVAELQRDLHPNPERARELQLIADKSGTLYPYQILGP